MIMNKIYENHEFELFNFRFVAIMVIWIRRVNPREIGWFINRKKFDREIIISENSLIKY